MWILFQSSCIVCSSNFSWYDGAKTCVMKVRSLTKCCTSCFMIWGHRIALNDSGGDSLQAASWTSRTLLTHLWQDFESSQTEEFLPKNPWQWQSNNPENSKEFWKSVNRTAMNYGKSKKTPLFLHLSCWNSSPKIPNSRHYCNLASSTLPRRLQRCRRRCRRCRRCRRRSEVGLCTIPFFSFLLLVVSLLSWREVPTLLARAWAFNREKVLNHFLSLLGSYQGAN